MFYVYIGLGIIAVVLLAVACAWLGFCWWLSGLDRRIPRDM
jgi:hypothetical protein